MLRRPRERPQRLTEPLQPARGAGLAMCSEKSFDWAGTRDVSLETDESCVAPVPPATIPTMKHSLPVECRDTFSNKTHGPRAADRQKTPASEVVCYKMVLINILLYTVATVHEDMLEHYRWLGDFSLRPFCASRTEAKHDVSKYRQTASGASTKDTPRLANTMRRSCTLKGSARPTTMDRTFADMLTAPQS